MDATLQELGTAEAALAACKADSACSPEQLRDVAHRAADARLAHDIASADASVAALAASNADVHAHQYEQGVAEQFLCLCCDAAAQFRVTSDRASSVFFVNIQGNVKPPSDETVSMQKPWPCSRPR